MFADDITSFHLLQIAKYAERMRVFQQLILIF